MYSDSETGLYYWGARYYDPKIGRGISADRMSLAEHVRRWRRNLGVPNRPPLELNPYVYTSNNPLRWIDPKGFANVAPEFGEAPYNTMQPVEGGDDTSSGEFAAKMLGALFIPPLAVATVVVAAPVAVDACLTAGAAALRSQAARQACMALGICSATARGEVLDDLIRDFAKRAQLNRTSEIIRQQTTTLVK